MLDDDVTTSDASRDISTALRHEMTTYRDLLVCDAVDSYQHLTEKGLTALKWIYSKCDLRNLDFVFKTDDDVYVYLPRLVQKAYEAIEDGAHFMGVINSKSAVYHSGRWSVPESLFAGDYYPPYCSGGGYGITRKAFKLLLTSLEKVPIFPMEDVFFTRLAIQWVQPELDIKYFPLAWPGSQMELRVNQIKKIVERSDKQEMFIIGHPIPPELWIQLHNALKPS
jgi:hypothetical protein